MKAWMGMLLAAVVGAGVAVAGIQFLQRDGLSPAAQGDPAGQAGSSQKLTTLNPAPKAAPAPLAIPRKPIFLRRGAALPKPVATRQTVSPVPDAEIQGLLAEADRFFARGEESQGLRLYRAAFAKANQRKDINLSTQVMKLLAADDVALWREKYISYLVDRGEGDKAFESQLSRGNSILLQGKESSLLEGWTELSQAHRLATNGILRTRVYDILNPMLKKNVFSLRMTPLVERYNVQPGDNLTRIAKRHQTTSDAITRLSGLKSEVIQPRSRLRILGGKVKIFVDKSDFLLWVTLDDRLLYQARVGLGRDNTTPVGEFSIEVRQKNPTWFRPGSDPIGPGDPRNVLGSRWLGFRDTEQISGIGIHGTVDSDSIGRESSAGCIRMLKEDVELVFDLVPRSTTVVITP